VRHKNLRGDIITEGGFFSVKNATKAVFERGDILMAGEDF